MGLLSEFGGKYHLKLNMGMISIAYKYREGKMKRTLERELKVCEIVRRETFKIVPSFAKSRWCLRYHALFLQSLFAISVDLKEPIEKCVSLFEIFNFYCWLWMYTENQRCKIIWNEFFVV